MRWIDDDGEHRKPPAERHRTASATDYRMSVHTHAGRHRAGEAWGYQVSRVGVLHEVVAHGKDHADRTGAQRAAVVAMQRHDSEISLLSPGVVAAYATMPPDLRAWVRANPVVANRRLAARAGFRGRVVTLNMGLGRDSIAMLCLLVEGGLEVDGVPLWVGDVDAVVFSDPGAEWAHTLAVEPRVAAFCADYNLRFVALRKPAPDLAESYLAALPPPGDPGRQDALDNRTWRTAAPATIEGRAAAGWYHLQAPILDDYEDRATIATRGTKDCTDKHKIQPIRKLVQDLALARFGLDNKAWGAAVRLGHRLPHLTLLGIAADESDDRAVVAHPLEGGSGPWYVTEAYPLRELGVRKADEAAILRRHGFDDVRKSGCVMCPYQPVSWFWALRETDPVRWASVVQYEAAALRANPRMFLARDQPITEVVARWRRRNPDATIADVLNKSYARGASCGRGDGEDDG